MARSGYKRKSNQESLGQVIDRLLNVYRLRSGLSEIQLQSDWAQIVGEAIASRTEELKLRDKTLLIRVNSAALKQELHYQRTQVVANINAHFKAELVKELKLI